MSTSGSDPQSNEHDVTVPIDPPPGASTPPAGDPTAPPPTDPPAANPAATGTETEAPVGPKRATGSKTSAVFVFAAVGAVILLLLLIFILQNLDRVPIEFLGLEGSVPIGVALLLAAVAGALLVAIAGGLRILQLRRRADHWRR